MNVRRPENPLVTVALPVLNGGDLLEGAVCSILNQTLQKWELLIIDDGSSDGAVDRLPCLSDPRIIVLQDGHNHGLSSRLNEAVSMAKGKYFSRMDHDDLCHPDRFIRQVAFLEKHPEVDLLATECIMMDEQEKILGRLPSAIGHRAICRRPWLGFYMAHPTWMGRAEWFRCNPYQDPAPYCCEDQELLLRTYQSSCFHTLPESLLAYRVRSHILWKKAFRTHAAMLKIQVRYFLARREWINISLCSIAGLSRVFREGLSVLASKVSWTRKNRFRTMPSNEELDEWEGVLKALKVTNKG